MLHSRPSFLEPPANAPFEGVSSALNVMFFTGINVHYSRADARGKPDVWEARSRKVLSLL